MLVTMFTDASWNARTNIGVWSMWAKLDGKTIRYSGRIKQPMPQIGTCELAAIANGLFCIKRKFEPPTESRIIAQTDSLEAIAAIKKGQHKRLEDWSLVDHIKSFVGMNGWVLDLRHVKGHHGPQHKDHAPRHVVNAWCDRECKRLMGIALAETTTKAA